MPPRSTVGNDRGIVSSDCIMSLIYMMVRWYDIDIAGWIIIGRYHEDRRIHNSGC